MSVDRLWFLTGAMLDVTDPESTEDFESQVARKAEEVARKHARKRG